MLIQPKSITEVVDKINQDYFYIPSNKTIYAHLR